MELPSEAIYNLLPVILVRTLGASPAPVSLVEGVGGTIARDCQGVLRVGSLQPSPPSRPLCQACQGVAVRCEAPDMLPMPKGKEEQGPCGLKVAIIVADE